MKNKVYQYLIELIRSAIDGTEITECNVDLQELCSLAKAHLVGNIIYPYLSTIKEFTDSELASVMYEDYIQAIAKEAKQEVEALRIMEAFERSNIEYMPLKGYIIKNLYPSPDMRQCTDFDIYVPFEFNRQACGVMDSLGYEYDKDSIGLGMHDNYHIGALMEVEIHKSLMSPDFPEWCKLSNKIIKNTTIVNGYKYRREFSIEDYYLYMQLHTIKHLKFSSCGIKSIMDIWIYLKHYQDKLNWEYINDILKKYDLVKIDKNLRALSDYWFNKIEPKDEIVYKLGEYIIQSGAFGTQEQYLSGKKTDETKIKRLIRVFFLPFDEMRIKYSILERIPILLPFAWIYRALYAAIYKSDSSKRFINKGDSVSKDMADNLNKFKKEIGL